MTTKRTHRRTLILLATALAVLGGDLRVEAQRSGRFLAKEDIILLGLGLRVEPAHQTVPKDIATIVSTFLGAPTQPGELPPFGPNTVVKGTLRGPSLATPLELTATANSPFNIPPLSVAGTHTLDNIRLESDGQVLLYGTPEIVTIDVIEKLLVTQVTSRPLSAAEIREKGIVFDKSSFQAYNFTAAFAIQDRPITIDFPVVLPTLQSAQDVANNSVSVTRIDPPGLRSLKTIVPDTLQIQTQVPNLSVVGFSLELELPAGQELLSFPIPGVIIVPGNIGFLNQFFSVMLMVGNVAPQGSGLVVTDLKADIILPAGKDGIVNSPDDPLRMARTASGESARTQPIVQPGADGKLGTADDIPSLGPGESGSGEYLVEGRREGTHVIEMEMAGTLNGLPIGPVPIRGRAAGSVLVRNPTFTLTFTHPDTVAAGEPYTLDVTVSNTSESPANFVSINLFPHNVSGATLVGEASRDIETIAPGDTATVSFDLVSRVTGKVTAATLDSDDNVAGRFGLKTSVGELGVPVSPDSLILPKESRSLPKSLLDAAVGLLGKAWAVATAPAGSLPAGVSRMSKQIVLDRAVEVAGAGFRVTLHEPLPDSAAQLAMDFIGSDYPRLAQLTKPADLPFVTADVIAFDQLRRVSVRGDVFARAVANLLADSLAAMGPASFHRDLAEKLSYRPGHLSVLAGADGGVLPVRVTVVDSSSRRLGGVGANQKVIKEIPFGDYLVFENAEGAHTGELAIVAAPEPGTFTVKIEPLPGAPPTTYTLSIVLPDATGRLRQVVYTNLNTSVRPAPIDADGSPVAVAFELAGSSSSVAAATVAAIVDPAPRLLGVVQQATADLLQCSDDTPPIFPGRVIAALFSEEVTPASAQDKLAAIDITRYGVDANAVVGVALQPGRRIAFIALRDPVGPFIERHLTVNGVEDGRGQAMTPQTLPIEITVTKPGGVVSGQVLDATGKPVTANVRLFYYAPCQLGISSKNTDADGRFSWDYVLKDLYAAQVLAVKSESNEARRVTFSVQRDGQRLNVNVVLLGRGTLAGRTLSEDGSPLAGSQLKVTSLTDQSQYGATSDDQGRFTIAGIPVGNVFVEAVNVAAKAQTNLSQNIPLAGGTTTTDIVLLNVETTQITVKTGTLAGHVLRADGTQPVAGVPVIVYYRHLSQPKVSCPPSDDGNGIDCPIAVSTTDAAGAFEFPSITAGALRIETFDQATLQQGEAGVVLPAGGAAVANILLGGGLGIVTGSVIDSTGAPVAGARVGGGLTLTTTDASGAFVLNDVPVGKRDIVAVSDALRAQGTATVDLVRPGETVHATIVLESHGSVAGRVLLADTVTPARSVKVYLFHGCPPPQKGICIVGTAVTDVDGAYRIDDVALGQYTVSAFNAALTEGNVAPVAVRFKGQIVRADVTFRGGGSRVVGKVFDDDGVTPLKARVAISGERIVTAGGLVGVGFRRVTNFAIADTNFTTGEFAFDDLLVGPFTLSAVGQFSPDPISLDGDIPQRNTTVTMNLRLQPTSVISGTVVNPDGVTPAGPNVVVRFKSDAVKIICVAGAFGPSCKAIPQGIQEEVVATDADGRYLLPIVNAGPFTLTAEDPVTGRVAQVHGTIRAGETADFTIRLLGVGALTVKVLGSDAATPIPGARVEVSQLDYPKQKRTFLADQQGQVQFLGGDAFTEGDLVIVATDLRNGFAGRASTRIQTDGQQVTVPVYLFNATGRVAGTIFQSDGLTPAPNTEVTISNCVEDPFGGCSSGGPLAFVVADGTGHYEQDQIPLGDFTLEVFDAATGRRGFATGRIDFNGQQVPVNVVEAALGLVTGHVLAGGTLAPLKGGELSLRQRGPSGHQLPELRGTSSVDGSFSFPGTSIGAFTVDARVRNPEPGGFKTVEGTIVREGETVDLPIIVDIPRAVYGTIGGRVVNPNGTAAANSRVELCIPGIDCSVPLLLTADADGRFELAHVPLGRFRATAKSQVTTDTGSIESELSFEGEVTDVTIVLGGLRQVTGTVRYFDTNEPAANVEVVLGGIPSSGCDGACTTFTDNDGRFSFVDVPAERFTIIARHTVTGLKGSAGGSLNPGEHKDVRIVLQPTASVSGRVLFANGTPAPRIITELVLLDVSGQSQGSLFGETAADGSFTFPTVVVGPFRLELQDSVGSGIARRLGTATGAEQLGDIVLDERAPTVAATTPPSGATGVPQNQTIQIVFSEPIDRGTITAANITLNGDTGALPALLDVASGDLAVTLTPLSPLQTERRYSLRVRGVKDRLGKVMAADFVSSFTTIDLQPPQPIEIGPGAGASGVTIDTTVRIVFSEPFDPTKLRAPPFALSGPAGAVEGRFDLLLGNTVMVFTPRRPLDRGASYRVFVPAVTDLAGNQQIADLDFTFSTTDGTAPELLGLTASNNGTVIENSVSSIAAVTPATHDIAVVDFYLNDVIAGSDRSAPFTFNFQAIPTLGAVGSQIKVSALATDTSGNRGRTPAVVYVTVTADQPPGITIQSPATGSSFRNGDRIVVNVRATDDLGVVTLGYHASTGKPQDAGTRAIAPSSVDRVEQFVFFIPDDAAPGSVVRIEASAVDTKGLISQAQPIELTVLDSVPPTVAITGLASGAKLRPGQQATAVVSAQDLGGVASITFRSSGATAFEQTRQIDPALPSVAAAYTFTVPSSARPGDVVNLDATAVDRAGNSTAAARLILPILDETPPTVQLHTSTGSLDIAPGSQVTVLADAQDEIGVTRVDLSGDGAFTVADAKQVSPPLGVAQASFTINVPAGLNDGAVLNLRATATDISNNVSTAASLTLTVRSVSVVTLPPSAIVIAGDSTSVPVTLGTPAPAGGLTVTFASRNATVAQPAASVHFDGGESSGTLSIAGIGGGLTTIDALIGGVQRASMTVTVRGGIVSGKVFDQLLNPVPGAQVTIEGGIVPLVATSDGAGQYFIEGVNAGLGFIGYTIKAINPVNGHIAFAVGQLSQVAGFERRNLILIAAGSVHGVVHLPDGQTPAGAGVRVDILRPNDVQSLGTTFTNDAGEYAFPLVTLGSYVVEANGSAGARGRTSVAVLNSGETVEAPVTFIGRGTVVGTVLDGSNLPVPNAELKFTTQTIFGYAPAISVSAQPDGTFRFENVPVGEFQIEARNPVGGAAGAVNGRIDSDQQEVRKDVVVQSFGSVQGTVFRFDGVTPVPNADVRAGGVFSGLFTRTDDQGHYRFDFLRLGANTIDVVDRGTSGRGRALVTLTTNGQLVTQNISLAGQGTIVATVTDFTGVPVSGAIVEIRSANELNDGTPLYVVTGTDGKAILEHVLTGPFRALGWAKGLLTVVDSTLAANEVKQLALQLQPTAIVEGIVYEPDGQTPATTGQVYVNDSGDLYFSPYFPIATAPIAADGTFRIIDLPLRTYNLSVRDSQGRLRAIARDVVLQTPGQIANRSLTLIGLGTVNGRVLNPDSSSAPNLDVEVRSLTPYFGNAKTVRTNAAGFYEATEMAAGPFTVSTGDVSRQLLGEGAGQITHNNETVTVDVLLQNNAITLPVTKWDGNNRYFQIQRDGSLQGSGGDLFSRTFQGSIGGMLLDVVANGVANRFAGATIGTVEEGGREVITRQQGLAGLNVTRKTYVSRTGYFGRNLEILTNPTAAPITVDVRVSSILPRYAGTDFYRLITTSSGDEIASIADAAAPDRWVLFDDTDTLFSGDTTAFVFDGPDALQRAGVLSVQPNPDPACQGISFSGCYAQKLVYEWQTVTIQPGESVAYLHFLAQQRQRGKGVASAQRLVQLPPEALVGLSAFEIGIIRNFAVPADGNSALAPLPSVTASISGTVFEADGVTPVRSGVQAVRFNTLSALYDVEQRVNSDAQGRFTITATLNDNGNTQLVPAEPFTLVGRHPLTNAASPTINGSFAAGSTTTAKDVVFSTSVLLKGFVRRHTGVVVPTATITASGGNLFAQVFQIGSDGSYTIGGMPSGTPLTITASQSHPQGFSLVSVTQLQGAAGEVIVRDLVFPPTGSLTGIVRTATGAVAPNVTVRIWQLDQFGNAISSRSTFTDTSGAFLFPDVPVSTYRLEATDPVSTVVSKVNVTIVQDQTIAQDLQLVGSGSVQVDVTYVGGAPATQTSVTVRDSAGITRFLQTNANGRATIANVPVGAFTVEAQHPRLFSAKATATGTMPAHGALVPVALTLPAVGNIQIQVNYAGGAPAPGAQIQALVGGSTFFQTYGSTDSAGRFTIANVVGGTQTIRAYHPQAGASADASGVLTAEGEVLPITVTLPAAGSVQVQVNSIDGAPVAGAQVLVRDAFDSFQRFGGITDSNGRVTVTPVRTAFDVQANDPIDSRFNRHTTGVIQSEGQIVPITIVLGTRGTVSGTLLDVNGVPVSQASVTLMSENPFLQFQVNAAADGTYSIADVPTGLFRVKAQLFNSTPGRGGSTFGTITQHGQAVTADVHLTDIVLSTNLSDANEFRYTIDRSGNVSGGLLTSSASLLVGQGTGIDFFNGDFAATPSADERQLDIANTTRFDGGFPSPLVGATVTRRVYVPPSGYFVRYLDIFDNPTGAPISLNVRLAEFLNSFGVEFAATSSGDQTLTTADSWLVTRLPNQTFQTPTALVFQGAGAAQALDEPTTTVTADRAFVGWKNVTIAPGGRAIFMHFALSQSSAASAQTAAERLVQLPPEAIEGIAAADRALIRNFVVPADGSSPLAAFGTVTGRVLTAAGTPVPRALVLVGGSIAPFYKAAIAVQADSDGRYTANTLDEGAFTVQAKDPATGLLSEVMSLSLAPGQSTITQDLVFAATGTLQGTVRFANGTLVTNGTVRVIGGSPAIDITVPIAGNGTYGVNVVPPGTYNLGANSGNPTFRFNTVSGIVVSGGSVTTANIALRGLIDARIRITNGSGVPVPSAYLFVTDNLFFHPAAVTDANGTAIVPSVGDGPFTVLVTNASGATLGTFTATALGADDGNTVDFGFTLQTGSITGTVRQANGTPVSSGFVQISSDGFNVVASANIAADGTYTVSALFPGTYQVYATVSGSTISSGFVAVAGGPPTVVDLKFPAIASIRFTARLNGTTPFVGYPVYISDASGFHSVGSTNGSGQVLITGVRESAFTIYLYRPGFSSLVGTVNGEVRAADHGSTIDVVFDAIGGSISGHVYGRGGATPLSEISVALLDDESGAFLASALTDSAGAYQLNDLIIPSGRFRVIASAAGVSAQQTGELTNGVVVDLVLPIVTLTGTVSYHDGAPAANAVATVAQLSADGALTEFSYRTSADGQFTTFARNGELELLAQDSQGVLEARLQTIVTDQSTPVLNVTLPPDARVSVTVRDANGQPAESPTTALTSSGTPPYSAIWGGGSSFELAHVPVGAFALQVCDPTYICSGEATGRVDVAGSIVALDVRLPSFGTVNGTALASDGVTPLPLANVEIVAGPDGPNGPFVRYLTADQNGAYALTGVPLGTVTAVALDSQYQPIGVLSGTLSPAGATLTLNIVAGTAVRQCGGGMASTLQGADGMVYAFGCSGELGQEPTNDEDSTGPYQYAHLLAVNGVIPSGYTPAKISADARTRSYGPSQLAGVVASRDAFVPQAGGFVRFLDSFTNITGAAVTIDVGLLSDFAGAIQVVVDPATTGNTYAVTKSDPLQSVARPVVGHVFGGANAVTANQVVFQRLTGTSRVRWTVDIPAGATVSVMHFSVKRESSDAAGAQAQAEALANLTDPNALAGMSAEQKARVVNFRIQ